MNRVSRRTIPDSFRLWPIQVFIRCFRIWIRFLELFGPKRRRRKLRDFREEMDSIEKDKREVLDKIKNAKGWGMFDALDEFSVRHPNLSNQSDDNKMRLEVQQIREESEALTTIREGASENHIQAIEGYREYIESHPNSHSSYQYLGGALLRVKDWDGSIAAYRQAERLAIEQNVLVGTGRQQNLSVSYARLSIAQAMHAKGDLTAAVTQYRAIIDNAPNEHRVSVSIAILYFGKALNEQGKRSEARTAWREATRRDKTGIIAAQAKELLKENP